MAIPKENNLEKTSEEYYLRYYVPNSLRIADCLVGKRQFDKAWLVLEKFEESFQQKRDWAELQKL